MANAVLCVVAALNSCTDDSDGGDLHIHMGIFSETGMSPLGSGNPSSALQQGSSVESQYSEGSSTREGKIRHR